MSLLVLPTPQTRPVSSAPGVAPASPRRWLLLLALLPAVQISPLWYPTPDASGYLSIARSLAAGTGPTNLGSRQLYLAPGYPLLISPAFWLGEAPFLAVSIVHWLLAVAFMLGVYAWARRHLPAAAVLLTAVVMVNVELWSLFRRTLSETAFMALLIWEIHLLHWAAAAVTARSRLVRTILAALGLAALALTRQAGLMVAAGFGLAMLLQALRGRTSWTRALVLSLAVGVPAAGAVVALGRIDRAMAEGSATYVDQIVDPALPWAEQVAEGLRLRVSEVGRLTIPGMFKAYARRGDWLNLNMAVYMPLAAALLLGWVRWVRRTGDVFALALPFYLALYVVWPFDQATRFTAPVLPVLLACTWTVLERFAPYRRRVFQALLVGHLAAALGYWLVVDLPRARAAEAQWPAVRQTAAVLRGDGGAVLAADVPPEVVWMLQFALDRRVGEYATGAAEDGRVRWIVTTREGDHFAGFVPHARTGNYRIYCREPGGEAGNRVHEKQKPSSPLEHGSGGEEGLTGVHEPLTARAR